MHDSEAVPQRSGEEPDPGGRAHQREAREIDLDGARHRTLADDDVDAELLHRLVEDLLEGRLQAVNLVDEQDGGGLEVGQNRGQVAGALERGTGSAAQTRPHLLSQDVGDRGLAETRWAVDQHVIERLVALEGRLDEDPEVGLHRLLADVLVESTRPQPQVDAAVIHLPARIEETIGRRSAGVEKCSPRMRRSGRGRRCFRGRRAAAPSFGPIALAVVLQRRSPRDPGPACFARPARGARVFSGTGYAASRATAPGRAVTAHRRPSGRDRPHRRRHGHCSRG